ncbi:MAG: metallophosphoesterase [Anaerolineales bacterium]|jgi:hypothetical protein
MNKTRHWWILLIIALVGIVAVLLRKARHNTYQVDQPITAAPSDCRSDLRFAVIGDFGDAGQPEADVAALIHGWEVDLIVTTGDNNYTYGKARTIDRNIGQYFADYIYPYKGDYGPGGTENRFFPVLGNHDWREESLQPHYDYFTLPGNERYYDFDWGPVHFFMLDSDPHEPDGRTKDSVQAAWFEKQIGSASAPWKLVFLHHPPYSSDSHHGSDLEMQWPFAELGVDAVFAGHAHLYERVDHEGIPYYINGLGGRWKALPAIHHFGAPLEGSQVRYNVDYGAQLVTVDQTCLNISFYSRDGELIDSYTVMK